MIAVSVWFLWNVWWKVKCCSQSLTGGTVWTTRRIASAFREDVRLCSDRSGSVCLCQHAPLSEPDGKLLPTHVISAIPPPTSLWRISGFLQERGDEPRYKQMAHSHNFLFILWPTCLDEALSVRFIFRSTRTRGKTSVWVISESLWKAVHYITSRWVLCCTRSFHLHARSYFWSLIQWLVCEVWRQTRSPDWVSAGVGNRLILCVLVLELLLHW